MWFNVASYWYCRWGYYALFSVFGPSSSSYKVSDSGTESAVVLPCLMLLAAFPTPLGRDFSDLFTPRGVDDN